MIPLVMFCPKCKKRINVPKFINNVNVLTEINIECADKKCGGKVRIKNKKENDNNIHSANS